MIGCLQTLKVSEMRKILMLVAMLYSAATMAQSPPQTGAKPLTEAKPPTQAKPSGAAQKPQSIAKRLQACLEIDDGTKGRLDCYDAIVPPKPNPKATVAKGFADCRFSKEEDQRLKCFNGFAEQIPRF
jgi:hypothetical protein